MTKRGPKTYRGKTAVRLNALKHGILSISPVIPDIEDAKDWDDHRAALFVSLSPEGHLERMLAERAALALWRLQRVARYEQQASVAAMKSIPQELASGYRILKKTMPKELTPEFLDDFDSFVAHRLVPAEPVLNKIIRYEAHLNRQLYQALHELEALQSRRRGEPAPLARIDVQTFTEP